MKNTCFYLLTVFLLMGQYQKAEAQENPVMFTVADDTVDQKEFTYIYEKNNSNDPELYSEESVKDYLDLYTNFKLKVKAARDAGLDTTQNYLEEYRNYREQLAEPYLKDTAKLNELLQEAYERMQEERNVSHILIKVPEGAPPADTAEAYKRAMELYRKAQEGDKTFEELAQTYSEDEHTKSEGGKLGYFSAFDMVYPFENVAYQLAEGEISKPLRTKYGYHILKLNDKRPYRGHIKTGHIMIKADQSKEEEWKAAKKQIDSVYKALKNGGNFEMLVRKYSDDKRSRQNQGKMPEFSSLTRHLPKKFRDKAFGLEEDGAFAEPFHTQYGWHIVKRIEQRGVGDFEKVKEKLKKQVKKDDRHELVKKSVIDRIKKANGYKFYDQNLEAFKQQVDSSLLKGQWKLSADGMNPKPLLEIGNATFTTKDFAKYLKKAQEKDQYQFLDYAIAQYVHDFKKKKVIAYEQDHLEAKYPKFRNLLTEYKEGILLFEITDEKVWSKAIEDSAGLRAFYEAHKKDYVQPQQTEAAIISCNGKQTAKEIQSQLEASDQSASEVFENANSTLKRACELEEGSYSEKEHKAIKRAKDEPGLYQVRAGNKHHVVRVNAVQPKGAPPLSKIRGKVIADYQNHLEEKWIDELKAQYQVKVNEEAVESLYKD